MNSLNKLKSHLRPGGVYRRAELARWSKAVDRHLGYLTEIGTLQKMSQGLYYCPGQASFGELPPEDEKLVRAFLKSDDFLLVSPNLYNSLEVGTTQLYNQRVVYNHKRHGGFELGGKKFDFRLKHKFPKKLTKEFLLIDLLGNLNELAEDRKTVENNAVQKITREISPEMSRTVRAYAGERVKKLLKQSGVLHA